MIQSTSGKKRTEARNGFERLEGKLIHAVRNNLKKKSEGDYALKALVDLYRSEINKLNAIVKESLLEDI